MKRIWIASFAGAAVVTMSFLLGQAMAGGPEEGVKKIIDLIKKGDNAGAKKAAQAYAKDQAKNDAAMEELMHLMKPAAKKGLTVLGNKDGIEQTLIKVGRDAPTAAGMVKNAEVYAEMGHIVTAIALVTEASAKSQKFGGKKTEKDWNDWAKAMHDSGIKLAEAGKSKSSADVKTAATKINAACNSCHTAFR
jgi:cytochrome c556